MKKLLSFGLIIALLIPSVSIAKHNLLVAAEDENQDTMTIKSITWTPDIESDGDNKLLKAKVDFHYEGNFIVLGQDYVFDIRCNVPLQRKRGGTKMLYDEMRDLGILDDMEIEGPHDFSVTLVFTFFPHEFRSAQKRGVTCDLGGYSGGKGGSVVQTKYGTGVTTYGIRIKPKDGKWKVINKGRGGAADAINY